MRYLTTIILLTLTLAVTLQAQQGQGGSTAPKIYTEVLSAASTAVVKGAPFSAEAVSENVQTLADGNKISRSHTTKMFRDSEGRFRREGGSGTGTGFGYTTYNGALTTAFGFSETISIFDPVANVRFIINPSSKTAQRMTFSSGSAEGAVIVNGQGFSQTFKKQIETELAAQKSHIVVLPNLTATTVGGGFNNGRSAGKDESLGTRNIEGVEAEGTRTVTTIEAGTIGNERPIEIVYERWYSKELQLIVYSRHYDPRFGEQTYRLTNINRSEPDRSLFQPPADYKIVANQTYNVITTKPAKN